MNRISMLYSVVQWTLFTSKWTYTIGPFSICRIHPRSMSYLSNKLSDRCPFYIFMKFYKTRLVYVLTKEYIITSCNLCVRLSYQISFMIFYVCFCLCKIRISLDCLKHFFLYKILHPLLLLLHLRIRRHAVFIFYFYTHFQLILKIQKTCLSSLVDLLSDCVPIARPSQYVLRYKKNN